MGGGFAGVLSGANPAGDTRLQSPDRFQAANPFAWLIGVAQDDDAASHVLALVHTSPYARDRSGVQ
jgi:hypothetical protein